MRSSLVAGFTLVELLINMAIIAILVAIAIPVYHNFRDKAKVAAAKQDLKTIHIAVEALAIDTNQWPGPNPIGATANTEIWDLTAGKAGLTSTNGAFPNWRGPYLQSISKDPWGMDYFFDPDYYIGGVKYPVLGSFGPNKVGKNVYDSDDVYLVLPTN